jgi:tetratricopeptide (TPR) repeat protein
MGTVYEAIDPLINRKVALKTMIQGLSENPDLRGRFFKEAQAAGGLRHPNIVTVYDLGEDKGQPFIAMEFVEGTDLEKVIGAKEPRSMEWKLDVLRQICGGLAYAHRQGIVHRDVKPANIRVTPDGEVKIMDFGIAHLQSSTMTRSGLVLGTVHYMSPEQIQGQKVDHRADIFSVGAVAYELVAYRRPFDGESLTAVMFKISHENPDPAALPKTDYSPRLEAIILKALARDVLARYQSLDQMLEDLQRLVQDVAPKLMQRGDPARTLVQQARENRAAGHLDDALRFAREAARLTPAPSEAAELVTEIEKEEKLTRAAKLVAEARDVLSSDPGKALDLARGALAIQPHDATAQTIARRAEGDVLSRRVEREMGEIRSEMERARSEGQLQKAMGLCRRLLELNPEDHGLEATSKEIEAQIHDKEVEQLCGVALAYAADGDVALAEKIASKIERMAPKSPRYQSLKKYLAEEASRKQVEGTLGKARDLLAVGQLEEARSAVEEVLRLDPDNAAGLEIRGAVTRILAAREKPREAPPAPPAPPAQAAPVTEAPAPPRPAPAPPAPAPAAVAPPPTTAVPPPAAPAQAKGARPEGRLQRIAAAARPAPTMVETPPPVAPPEVAPALTPIPGGLPENSEAASLLQSARLLIKERQLQKALGELERAATLDPEHPVIQKLLTQTKVDARRAEIETLTTSALNSFVQNDYKRARKAVDKALALDPENKKARELLKILGALG